METIKATKSKITYYEDQKSLAYQELSIVTQRLEDIDHYFSNYGYHNEFNLMTQIAANERAKQEVRFDKITSDIYHFNRKLVELSDELHSLHKKELIC